MRSGALLSGNENMTSLPPQVLSCYDLGNVLAVEPAPGGLIEEGFVVSGTQRRIFVKRRAPTTTSAILAADHHMIRFLVDHGFPTPPLISTVSNTTWLEYNGRFYEAYAFVEGEPFTIGDREQIAAVGRMLGRYHALSADYTPPNRKRIAGVETSVTRYLDLKSRVVKPLDWLLKHRLLGSSEKRFVQAAVQELKDLSNRFQNGEGLVRLVAHGAVEPGNVLFTPANEVAALVDWSDSLEFVRVFDVASALLKFIARRADAVLPGQVGPMLSWPRVESFAGTYRETIILTEPETELLPWLMLALRLTDALWIDERYDLNYRRELKMASELHDWLDKNRATLGALFCNG